MQVYIWVQATTDWADEVASTVQLSLAFAPKVDLRNRTFPMTYHLFRHRVRDIARGNHSAVAGTCCAHWDAIPDGVLVVRVGDDGCLPRPHPVAWRPEIAGIYWTSTAAHK